MLKAKQISVIALVIVLMTALYALDIKRLVKEEGDTNAKEQPVNNQLDLQAISQTAKNSLNANLATEIENSYMEI